MTPITLKTKISSKTKVTIAKRGMIVRRVTPTAKATPKAVGRRTEGRRLMPHDHRSRRASAPSRAHGLASRVLDLEYGTQPDQFVDFMGRTPYVNKFGNFHSMSGRNVCAYPPNFRKFGGTHSFLNRRNILAWHLEVAIKE